MSEITFSCPHCEQELEASEDMFGDTLECPACNGTIQVPVPEAAAPQSSAPASKAAAKPAEMMTNVKQGVVQRRVEFTGTGGALFGKFFVGMLLTGITLGIYLPWFIAGLYRYIYDNTTLKTQSGDLKFRFTGTGGALFATYLLGVILSIITLGLYVPWFMVRLTKYFSENSAGESADGSSYAVSFTGTGLSLFGTYVLGAILTFITLGIYMPWFMVSLTRFYVNNASITADGTRVGGFKFSGGGGKLFGTYLLGMILTSITFGIYGAWFACSLMKYFARGTEVAVNEDQYRLDFTGSGATYFGINFVGYLLTMLTMGIYGAWYMCNLLKFQLENTKVMDRA